MYICVDTLLTSTKKHVKNKSYINVDTQRDNVASTSIRRCFDVILFIDYCPSSDICFMNRQKLGNI